MQKSTFQKEKKKKKLAADIIWDQPLKVGRTLSQFPRSLVFDIQYVPREDSFRTTNKVNDGIKNSWSEYCEKKRKQPVGAKDQTTYYYLSQVCQQVSYGIQALFGPSDLILGSHVQSLCDALVSGLYLLCISIPHHQDIPHLEARIDIDNSYRESSLNLHPSQDLMNQAYKVIVSHLQQEK